MNTVALCELSVVEKRVAYQTHIIRTSIERTVGWLRLAERTCQAEKKNKFHINNNNNIFLVYNLNEFDQNP